MIVKVCGMRDAANIKDIDEIDAVNWMGFIFFAPSKRNVIALPDYMPQHSKRVGVFVNEDQQFIIDRVKEFGFNLIQLHGHESAEYCKDIRNRISSGIQIIKMIQIENLEDIAKTQEYARLVDYFLFETKCQGYGGSGQQFDWDILNKYKGNIPFLITGGIGADDADKVNAFSHPMFAGIDLNSKFEVSPALKDTDAIKQFVSKINAVSCK